MRTSHALVLSAALAAFFVSVVPTAAADTCMVFDPTVEGLVCPPVLGVYCTLYAVVEKYPVLPCALRAVPEVVLPPWTLP